MSGSSSTFLISLFLWCLATAALAITLIYRRQPKQRVIRISLLFSLCAIPMAALLVGSFHSHGFSIPWYFYGAVTALLSFLLSTILTLAWPKQK